MFSEYGKVDRVCAKNSRDRSYSFAFVDYLQGTDTSEAVNAYLTPYSG